VVRGPEDRSQDCTIRGTYHVKYGIVPGALLWGARPAGLSLVGQEETIVPNYTPEQIAVIQAEQAAERDRGFQALKDDLAGTWPVGDERRIGTEQVLDGLKALLDYRTSPLSGQPFFEMKLVFRFMLWSTGNDSHLFEMYARALEETAKTEAWDCPGFVDTCSERLMEMSELDDDGQPYE